MLRRTIGYCTIRGIKQLLSNRPNELDKSKLPLGAAEQTAREKRKQRSYKALRRERACPALRGPGGALHTGSPGGRKGAPLPWGASPLSTRQSPQPNPHLFRFGLGGGLGSGEEGCLGEGCLDCDPDSRGWESPNHEFLPSSDPVWRRTI